MKKLDILIIIAVATIILSFGVFIARKVSYEMIDIERSCDAKYGKGNWKWVEVSRFPLPIHAWECIPRNYTCGGR